MPTTSSYVNGSDMLLFIGDKAIGHCTSHTANFNSETKDRAVKPVASAASSASLWKDKTVTGLSVSISFDGLRYYGETEEGFNELLAAWKTGQPVTAKCLERGEAESPYLTGSFVIASLTETSPANEDATYSGSLENSGPVTVTESALS